MISIPQDDCVELSVEMDASEDGIQICLNNGKIEIKKKPSSSRVS